MSKNVNYKRQSDLVTPEELNFPILIIGAGGIGSWTALTLAKMGCTNLMVQDFDLVEPHNLPSQLYKPSQVGVFKVDALHENILDLTGTSITPINARFPDEQLPGIPTMVISAVDSMEQRKKIWAELKKSSSWDCYIDMRMGGEVLRILVVNPLYQPSVDKYEKSINTKAVVSDEPCTARAIVYNTQMAGGLVANIVKKFAKSEDTKLSLVMDMIQQEIV